MVGKTRRMLELLLHRITRYGIGSRRKMMETGRAAAAEEAPGGEEDWKQMHIQIV